MFKKLVIASSLLLASTSVAIANSAPYVGASTGITVNTANNNWNGFYRGVPFNLFAGYGGIIMQNFYLAGELQGTIGTAEISNHGWMKSSYGISGSLLPGFMLCDQTLLFARLGVIYSHFGSFDESSTGGQIGLGMQTSLTQNMDIRGEYDFAAYRSVSKDGLSTNPRSDLVTVGVVYKFD